MSSSARKTKKPPARTKTDAPKSEERIVGGFEASQPEIRVAYTPAGRETLEAITAEIVGGTERHDSLPEIQVRETPAGRETLAAIAEELQPSSRGPLDTLPYGDRIKNAPGAHSPSSAPELPRSKQETTPEITVGKAPAGRDTLAAIEQEMLNEPAPTSGLGRIVSGRTHASKPEPTAEPSPDALEIFEMATFVVRGPDAARLSTDALRRRFVEEHLMHRLPVSSLDEIDRVDVTPWTVRGTFVVRVWCKVSSVINVE